MLSKEAPFDFRKRHWQVHHPERRDPERSRREGEVMLSSDWSIVIPSNCPVARTAGEDFADYLRTVMGLALPVRKGEFSGPAVRLIPAPEVPAGFDLDVSADGIRISAADAELLFRGTLYLEECMDYAGAPVMPLGRQRRTKRYRFRSVHSGCGVDEFPDEELNAVAHAGYDAIDVFVKDFDHSSVGPCDFNDILRRAKRFGIKVMAYNYMTSYKHPDDPDAEAFFDSVYGEFFRRFPDFYGIILCGESLEFPSRDPHTSGKRYAESVTDGIPDPRPSPGWYPCFDYPAYLRRIEQAVHKVKPDALVVFSTYNWCYLPPDVRRKFVASIPENIMLQATFDIQAKRRLEDCSTPVMDYSGSVTEPGEYFTTEIASAYEFHKPISGNVNTAGIAWDFGVIPYIPAPDCWYRRFAAINRLQDKYALDFLYSTHHQGWWDCIASDIGKLCAWTPENVSYEELLERSSVRDYGRTAAPSVRKAWKLWSDAMGFYTASNEDQYGPWRVGPSYPFIFPPNMSRALRDREIRFPTDPAAKNGWHIIKTFYRPYEYENQTPAFLRHPAEVRSLTKMLALWEQGIAAADEAVSLAPERCRHAAERLANLGKFIACFIRTTIHIKEWYALTLKIETSADRKEAEGHLDQMFALLDEEEKNVRAAFAPVEQDSRLGFEPSMLYVTDAWHLDWKLRQMACARQEMEQFRKAIHS